MEIDINKEQVKKGPKRFLMICADSDLVTLWNMVADGRLIFEEADDNNIEAKLNTGNYSGILSGSHDWVGVAEIAKKHNVTMVLHSGHREEIYKAKEIGIEVVEKSGRKPEERMEEFIKTHI